MPYYLVMLPDGAKQVLAANSPQEALTQAEVVWPDTMGVVDLDEPDMAQILLDHLYPSDREDGAGEEKGQQGVLPFGLSLPFTRVPRPPSPVPATSGPSVTATGEPLTIYTDGSSIGNPGPAGWAYVRSDGQEASGHLIRAGNNVAELTAVWQALQSCPSGASVEIVTDSRNVMGWLAERWKRKDPQVARTVEAIEEVIRNRKLGVTYQKVPAHADHCDNERAHTLAEKAARQRSQREA